MPLFAQFPLICVYIASCFSRSMSAVEMESWWLLTKMLLIGTLSVAAVGLGSLMLRLVYIRWKYRHIPSPKTRRYRTRMRFFFFCNIQSACRLNSFDGDQLLFYSFILGHLYEISKEKAKSRGDHPIDSLMMKW